LEPCDVPLNYWRRRVPADMDAPLGALMATILCIRQLPAHERQAWRDAFDHDVFGFDEAGVAAIFRRPRAGCWRRWTRSGPPTSGRAWSSACSAERGRGGPRPIVAAPRPAAQWPPPPAVSLSR